MDRSTDYWVGRAIFLKDVSHDSFQVASDQSVHVNLSKEQTNAIAFMREFL